MTSIVKRLGFALPVLAVLGLAWVSCAQGQTDVKPKFSTDPSLSPHFAWNQSDYALRCQGSPVAVDVSLPEGWRAKVASGSFRGQDFEVKRALQPGRAFAVTFRDPEGRSRAFHIRCLPVDFPRYRVKVNRRGGPRLTVINLAGNYAAAFDAGGAPVWWYRHGASPENPEIRPNGTLGLISVRNLQFERFEVRSLSGRLIRTLLPRGRVTSDSHDFQRLPNGNFMFGTHREVGNVNGAGFGGPANSTLSTAQIQEVRPNGTLVWKWNSFPRIRAAETGRWWKIIRPWGMPYDQTHWNSVDRRGRYVLLSFRHLDAVYKIDRRTGRVVWKLGGTRTGKSLRVKGDRYGRYPFGGQHDARFMPDGSITIFDNQSYFKRRQSRAVRYRINERKRTATLVEEIRDPRFKDSLGFGSARVGPGGNWIVCWGATGKTGNVAAYSPQGKVLYRIFTPGATQYRANPVFSRKPTMPQIRRAMNRMASR